MPEVVERRYPVCHVLTEGWLHFDKDTGMREAVRARCTTTLIVGREGCILVDPGADDESIPRALAQHSYTPADIDTVFLTHSHADHYEGLELFPGALWCMAPEELSYWRHQAGGASEPIFTRVFPARTQLQPGVRVFPTPGHTPGHSSVLVANDQGLTIIAGDAVMNNAYFRQVEPFHNAIDWDTATRSMRLVGALADEVIPGHGIRFSTGAPRPLPRPRGHAGVTDDAMDVSTGSATLGPLGSSPKR